MLTKCSFDSNINKHDYYSGRDSMKNFCKNLKEHVTKITNFKRLRMIPSTEKENKSYHERKLYYICRNKFNRDIEMYWKVRDQDHYFEKYGSAAV